MPEVRGDGEGLFLRFIKDKFPEEFPVWTIYGHKKGAFNDEEPVNLPFVHVPRLNDIGGASGNVNLLDLSGLGFAGDFI